MFFPEWPVRKVEKPEKRYDSVWSQIILCSMMRKHQALQCWEHPAAIYNILGHVLLDRFATIKKTERRLCELKCYEGWQTYQLCGTSAKSLLREGICGLCSETGRRCVWQPVDMQLLSQLKITTLLKTRVISDLNKTVLIRTSILQRGT